jgi:hypothetical protein
MSNKKDVYQEYADALKELKTNPSEKAYDRVMKAKKEFEEHQEEFDKQTAKNQKEIKKAIDRQIQELNLIELKQVLKKSALKDKPVMKYKKGKALLGFTFFVMVAWGVVELFKLIF